MSPQTSSVQYQIEYFQLYGANYFYHSYKLCQCRAKMATANTQEIQPDVAVWLLC